MKKFNLKKIAMMGLAAMMAVSAMSVTCFATAESDSLVAVIGSDSDEAIEVYESDLIDGEYSTIHEGVTITIGENNDDIEALSANVSLLSTNTVFTGNFTGNGVTNETLPVSNNISYEYSFSVANGSVKYTPYYFAPASGYNTLKYAITGDASYGSKVVATVYVNITGSEPMPIDLYSGTHNVSFSGLGTGDRTYAKVYNKSYSSTATGICDITLN